jgi:hypothetical protein
MVDWLSALDDGLTERITTGTGCGNLAGDSVRFSVWEARTVAVAHMLCRRCKAIDPEGTALAALMRERYGKESHECPVMLASSRRPTASRLGASRLSACAYRWHSVEPPAPPSGRPCGGGRARPYPRARERSPLMGLWGVPDPPG